VGLIVGQLPPAVWSPSAPVKEQHRILSGHVLRDLEGSPVDCFDNVFRERVPHVESLFHCNHLRMFGVL
jgi:hypothetical protein